MCRLPLGPGGPGGTPTRRGATGRRPGTSMESGEVALRGDLRRQAEDLDEALRLGLVERVARVVGGEVEVVQRLLRPPAGDDGAATLEGHPDVAGDVLVGL